MRYKPPYSRIAVFDQRADAIQLAVEQMLNMSVLPIIKQSCFSDLPYYVAYVVAIDMINKLKDELGIEFVEFIENGKPFKTVQSRYFLQQMMST